MALILYNTSTMRIQFAVTKGWIKDFFLKRINRCLSDTELTTYFVYLIECRIRVIFMEDHIQWSPDRSLLKGRHTSKWSLWDVV